MGGVERGRMSPESISDPSPLRLGAVSPAMGEGSAFTSRLPSFFFFFFFLLFSSLVIFFFSQSPTLGCGDDYADSRKAWVGGSPNAGRGLEGSNGKETDYPLSVGVGGCLDRYCVCPRVYMCAMCFSEQTGS